MFHNVSRPFIKVSKRRVPFLCTCHKFFSDWFRSSKHQQNWKDSKKLSTTCQLLWRMAKVGYVSSLQEITMKSIALLYFLQLTSGQLRNLSCFAWPGADSTAFLWGMVLGDYWSQKSFAVSWTSVLVLVPCPLGHANWWTAAHQTKVRWWPGFPHSF